MIFKWANSYVDPHHRGSYSAGKEMLSLFAGMVVTLIIGYVMDLFTESGNIHGGFVFAAVSIFIFCVCDFICLWLIDKENAIVTEKAPAVPFREVLKNTLGNRRFLYIVVLTVIWDIARYSIIGFVGTYRIGELAYTVGVVQLINIAGNGVRFLISKPFGRFSDRFTYAKGASLGMLLAAIGFATLIFTTPTTRYLIIAYTVFYSVSGAGTNQNLMNITYSYVDSKYFVQAAAIRGSISGVCGFLASLGTGKLLDVIQANGNTFLGIHVYGQQVLSAISLLLIVVAILFNRFVVGKQSVMRQ
jgi:Na+/melibiose symporter-like transporter